MRVVINTAAQRFGGAIQVALSFINECKVFSEHEFYIWVGPGVRKSLDESEFPVNFHFEYFDFGIINLKVARQINRTLQEEEKRIKPDVIIATSGPSYFHSKAPQVVGYNLPLYIYPESPFLKTESVIKTLKRRIKKIFHFYYFKRDADIYVVQTNDVKERLSSAFNTDRVHTITNTASSFYHNWESFPQKLPVKKEGVFRFVTISSYYGHKDLEIIPKVQNILKQRGITEVQFVLTLKENDFNQHIGKQEGLYNVGPISPAECPSLYEECDGMFLPTLAECFSASYPEAMIMEKPIVTTNLGFSRSVCRDAALYYEAKNADSAATQIEKLINDKKLQNQLVKLGKAQLRNFDTPQERAKKYIQLCEKLVEESRKF